MAGPAKTPLTYVSKDQLKYIHHLLRRAAVDKEDIYAIYHVESLKDLSAGQANVLIDRLKQRLGLPVGQPSGRRSARRPAGTIRNATQRQRNTIAQLFDELFWGPDKARAWLQQRHGITNLQSGVFSTQAASDVIVQLTQIIKKPRSDGATQRRRANQA